MRQTWQPTNTLCQHPTPWSPSYFYVGAAKWQKTRKPRLTSFKTWLHLQYVTVQCVASCLLLYSYIILFTCSLIRLAIPSWNRGYSSISLCSSCLHPQSALISSYLSCCCCYVGADEWKVRRQISTPRSRWFKHGTQRSTARPVIFACPLLIKKSELTDTDIKFGAPSTMAAEQLITANKINSSINLVTPATGQYTAYSLSALLLLFPQLAHPCSLFFPCKEQILSWAFQRLPSPITFSPPREEERESGRVDAVLTP